MRPIVEKKLCVRVAWCWPWYRYREVENIFNTVFECFVIYLYQSLSFHISHLESARDRYFVDWDVRVLDWGVRVPHWHLRSICRPVKGGSWVLRAAADREVTKITRPLFIFRKQIAFILNVKRSHLTTPQKWYWAKIQLPSSKKKQIRNFQNPKILRTLPSFSNLFAKARPNNVCSCTGSKWRTPVEGGMCAYLRV